MYVEVSFERDSMDELILNIWTYIDMIYSVQICCDISKEVLFACIDLA